MTRTTATSRIGLALAAGALAIAALTGQASATQPSSHDSSGSRAGLTSTERAQLDAEVADTLRDTSGGERIGLNQIAWDGGDVVMTFPLPGEDRAPATNEPAGARDEGCDYGRVCLWEDEVLGGRSLEFYTCKFQKLRWYNFTNKTSSWVNNQSKGTKSTLYYWTGSEVRSMGSLRAWDYAYYLYSDNKADFLRVC